MEKRIRIRKSRRAALMIYWLGYEFDSRQGQINSAPLLKVQIVSEINPTACSSPL
jgi:hypothetical protein